MEILSRLKCACVFAKYGSSYDSLLKHLSLSYRYGSQNPLRRRAIRVLNNNSDDMSKVDVDPINTRIFQAQTPQRMPANVDQKEANLPVLKEKKKIAVQPYVKLPDVDGRFISALTQLKSRKLREKNAEILLEGKRLINDAISAGVHLKTLFFSKEESLSQINLQKATGVKLYKVLYKTMKIWSDVTTSSGIMGVFQKPSLDESLGALCDPIIPVTVLCDNIRDPGNMGSIIRNAAAAGCRCILLTKGCIDPWEQKVLRTGMGAHFRIPIVNNIPWEHVINYLPKSSSIYIADNTADVEIADDEIFNEEDYLGIENTEEKYVYQSEEGETTYVDNTYTEEAHLEKYQNVALPCYLYSNIKFPKDDLVLYVGGETHGVSPQAKKLACEFGGQSVKIPLENGIESLNSSFAAAIILYEIKRQLKEAYVFEKPE